ncbi:MAG TPA: multiheme c-type cytochrome [Methylomirabilota bacterium]|nr:multiheme c-type cytochrome [Methylomirabilota bacterium]
MRRPVALLLAAALAGCAANATPPVAGPRDSLASVGGGESVEAFVARHWRMPLAPQGPPPARFSALEASLAPEACGACHPVQYADWRTSMHAASMGPGIAGQLAEMLVREPAGALACHGCHAPLAEQSPITPDTLAANPGFDPALRAHGIPCAACHVRGHARFGPPRRDGSLASAVPRETLPHAGVTRAPAYLASAFCRGCHQFGPDGYALNGKPLEDTYEEWRASPFASAGVQCQDCHMPDRRHLWRGVHDRDMVERGLTIAVTAESRAPALIVTSTGVGHRFPTYVTPLVVLRAEQLDAAGRPISGTRAERRIGREVTLDLERELADTRLAPGESATLTYAQAPTPSAAALRLSVIVFPDAFYTGFFEALLRQGAGRGDAQIREALEATRRSAFVLFERDVPLQR